MKMNEPVSGASATSLRALEDRSAFLSRHIGTTDDDQARMLAALGFGAVLGHMFSPWLRFRGGKGVATGFGAFVALAPIEAAIAGVIWIAIYAVTKVSSVGSLVAVTALPVILYLRGEAWGWVGLAVALWPLIIWKHADNIRRLLRRQETKV